MEIYDFKVILEPDETGGYLVSCPSLPGCYSYGETVRGAMKSMEQAILQFLEDMQAGGDPEEGDVPDAEEPD